MSTRAPPQTRLVLLGTFELMSGGERVELPVTAQRVLAFLALRRSPVLRAYVAGNLWPDTNETRAHGSLRSALWRLHQLGHELVEVREHRLAAAPGLQVDVAELLALAQGVLDLEDEEEVEAAVPRLAAKLSGDLLPDWYDEWVTIEREHLRQLRLHALESLAERLAAAGRFSSASEAALAAVAADPLRESAHRSLIRIHLAEGNAVDALRQYTFFRRLAGDRLGVLPSTQMEELVHGVARAVR